MISTRVGRKLNFCRKNGLISIAVLCAALAGVVAAAAYQRRPPHKLRAIALLEVTPDADGAANPRFVPIAILDNKRFHESGIYEARPRPMAIADGVVYEAQKTGLPVGYATITGAEKKKDQWIVQWHWDRISESRPSNAAPVVPAAPGSDRPILRRPGGSEAKPPDPAPSSSTPPASGGQAVPAAGPPRVESVPEDTDRPKLKRQSGAAPETPAGGGKPGASAKSSAASKSEKSDTSALRSMIAISDAEPTNTRSYDYIWKTAEREEAEGRIRKMALSLLPAEAHKGPPPALANVVIRAFDLDLSNDAVMVLTAEVPPASPAPAAKGAPATPAKPVTRYIAIIARLNFEGVLVKLAASVTDSTRLDVAPRMELIDAVDVEGDGPAELVFREYSFDEKSFVIYGIGRTTITTVFEGASQPLK